MIRMTEDEYKERQARLSARMVAAASRIPSQAAKVEKKSDKKANKYGAQRVTIQGIPFDSKAEAKRYLQLKAMEQAGEISNLEIQVDFPLVPDQLVDGRKERGVKYVADFRYIRDGQSIVEDVKSAPTKTKEFIIKRKLVLWLHKVAVQEVLMA